MSQFGARRGRDRASRTLADLVARQGFGESTLLTQWETVVGARVAAVCQPLRLQWPSRGKTAPEARRQEPATLILRVEPGFGLDVQHMSNAILERVNTHLGWRCVARLVLRQETLQRAAPREKREPPRDAAARAWAERATEGVADDALRRALITLGERALASRRSPPRKS